MNIASIYKARWIPVGLALMLAGSTAWAATQVQPPSRDKTETESINIVTDEGWANPALANAAASSGQALLGYLQSANAFLDVGAPQDARDALITASEFANAMQRTMPFMAMADDVKTARNKLLSGEEEAFYDDLLPIYAKVDAMQFYAPQLARHVRGKVKQAEKLARGGKHKEAAQTLSEVSDEVTHTTVYLPLDFVNDQIQVAMGALKGDQPDTHTAQGAIDRALNSLVERQLTVVDTPHT